MQPFMPGNALTRHHSHIYTHLQALGFQAVGASGCVVHVAHKGGRVQRVAGCMRQGREGETNQEVS